MKYTVSFIVMKRAHKIAGLIIGIHILSLTSLFVYGQNNSNKIKQRNKATISFQTSSGVLFSTIKQGSIDNSVNNSIVFRKPLSTHFKAEAMLNFSIMQNPCCIDKIFGNKSEDIIKASKLSVPVTLQYNPLSKKNKIQPYLGAGVLLENNISNKYASSAPGIDYNNTHTKDAGTKYISIIFTQGVTYEINTKIHINQSLHFIPDADKNIGFDIGIGYTIQ